MVGRRIGGGLLAGAGVAAPSIIQMMGLTLPQPVGFALLALCFVAVAAGLAFIFGPQPKTLAELEHESRKRVRDDLGRFMISGGDLRRAMADLENEPPLAESDQWVQDLDAYLHENLGASYAARVHQSAAVPIGMSSLSGDRVRYDSGLRIRLFHLEQFCRELA